MPHLFWGILHIYGGGLAAYPLAASKGREVWMTEHLDTAIDHAAVLGTAREIHDCLAVANFNAYIWWYARRFYGPLGEDGIITKRGHVMTQFAKFIRPGAVRVDATANPATGVYVSAYKRDTLVIVAVNQSTADVSQAFAVQNGTVNTVTPWVTSSTLSLAQHSAIAVSGGSFTATLPAQSVTTLVGELLFPAPTIVTPPQGRTVAAGTTAVLEVIASGQFVTYQWMRNGQPLAGATNRLLTMANVQAGDAGSYAVTVTNSGGSVTSGAATLSVVAAADPGRLINISTRSPVGTAGDVQIGGFVLTGSAAKPILIRAAGPVLGTNFGLPGVLADPIIELYNQAGTIVATNDDWDAALAPTFAAVQAFAWTAGSKDAALLVTLAPGAYTAQVKGKNGDTGIALVEAYDTASANLASKLVNISTRSLVQIGDGVQIGGFVVGGTTARTVVIRASGPELSASFGLPGVLVDPVIDLHDQSNGAVIGTADDWEAAFTPHFDAVGAFDWTAESRDAALVMMLNPGAYTVIVRGKNSGTGVALVEIYEEP